MSHWLTRNNKTLRIQKPLWKFVNTTGKMILKTEFFFLVKLNWPKLIDHDGKALSICIWSWNDSFCKWIKALPKSDYILKCRTSIWNFAWKQIQSPLYHFCGSHQNLVESLFSCDLNLEYLKKKKKKKKNIFRTEMC